MLKSYGYNMEFVTLIQGMYDKAFSSVKIKLYVAGSFPIQCSVRQGCPINIILFSLVLNPLMCMLELHFRSIRIGHRKKEIAVVAYADDVTIFVTAPTDISIIGRLLLTYERTMGARLNIRKTKAIVRLGGHIDELAGNHILSGRNHTGFQILEYSISFREHHLVVGDMEG